MIARTVTIFAALLMLGCNTGGSSSGSSKNVQVPSTTADIQAPEGLTFTSSTRIAMALDISDYPQSKAYLSVYSQYQQTEPGQWQINYNSRLLGRSLIQQRIQQELTVAQHITSLLVVVWFYDQTIEPLIYEIQVADHRV